MWAIQNSRPLIKGIRKVTTVPRRMVLKKIPCREHSQDSTACTFQASRKDFTGGDFRTPFILFWTRVFGNCSHSNRFSLLYIPWNDRQDHLVSVNHPCCQQRIRVDGSHWLVDWSEKVCPNLTINPTTDLRFSERLVPSHSPRSCAHGTEEAPVFTNFSPWHHHTTKTWKKW